MSKDSEYNIIISDSSCLIGLTNINALDILRQVYQSITITPEVAQEYILPVPKWIEIRAVKNPARIAEFSQTLDAGEASSLALAVESENALLVLDEKKARQVANSLGLEIIGTLGILVKAFQRGLLPDYQKVLDDLRKKMFRMPADAEKLFVK